MRGVKMNKLTSDAIEVVNRNALVTVALNRGYNAYLPVYDNGIDLILHNEASGDTSLSNSRGGGRSTANISVATFGSRFDRGCWYVPTR
jgi:hypothetical protein